MNDHKTGRESEQFNLRFPEGMREKVRLAAEMSGRSMNAQLIQFIKQGLEEDGESNVLKLKLPFGLRSALEFQAANAGLSAQERIIEVLHQRLSDPTDDDALQGQIADEVEKNAELRERNEFLKRQMDVDFFAFYGKVIQMRAFLTFMMNQWNENVPDSLMRLALDMQDICERELQALKDRYDDIVWAQKWHQRAAALDDEIAASQQEVENEDSMTKRAQKKLDLARQADMRPRF